MKKTGIIMSGNHPQLVRDKLKTMTRRTYGLELVNQFPDDWRFVRMEGDLAVFLLLKKHMGDVVAPQSRSREIRGEEPNLEFLFKCPYGQVGNHLWVKETWATEKRNDHLQPSEVPETAKIYYVNKDIHSTGGYSLFVEMGKVRSSMFMCEWMSRITLEILDIRGERVQDITAEDAKVEGVNPFLLDKLKGGTKYKMLQTYHHEAYPLISHADKGEIVVFECPNMGFARLHHTQWQEGKEPVFRIPVKEVFSFVGALEPDYRNGFRILWDSLNSKRGYGWDFNLWVWILGFKVITNG